MDRLWKGYLDSVLPIDTITQLVVYTDKYRYWLVEGLLDVAEIYDWKISLQLIEEITDEEGMEIRQSLAYLSADTFLVAIFSDRNPIIDELNTIFPLLQRPRGFQGYSLVLHQSLPDQYYPVHLQTDIFAVAERESSYRRYLGGEIVIKNEETYLEVEIENIAMFPFDKRSRHMILPATQVVIEVNADSMNGTLSVQYSIGAFSQQEELVDPFGLVDKPLQLLIEDGKIVDIQGNNLIKRRLLAIIELPYKPGNVQLSIGLGPDKPVTGFVEHDRLLNSVLTVSWIDDSIDSFLEFVIGPVNVES